MSDSLVDRIDEISLAYEQCRAEAKQFAVSAQDAALGIYLDGRLSSSEMLRNLRQLGIACKYARYGLVASGIAMQGVNYDGSETVETGEGHSPGEGAPARQARHVLPVPRR